MSSSLSISNDAARTTTRAVRVVRTAMAVRAARGVETRSTKRKRETAEAVAADTKCPGALFGLLPLDVVIAHVLRNVPDPADLAVLRAVSKGMREAVDATERKIEELDEDTAAERGCLSTLLCSLRRGRLRNRESLCSTAALIGNLDELKLFRRLAFPWNALTSANAASRGHLEILKWAHANGCPWDARTFRFAAHGGHLEVLKWLLANSLVDWKLANKPTEGNEEMTCTAIAMFGHLETLYFRALDVESEYFGGSGIKEFPS